MVNWQALAKKLALSRGSVIDPKRARIIKDELLADGKIDKEEFAFLLALRREAQWVDGQVDDMIFNAVTPKLLEDGYISEQETQWLQKLLTANGPVGEREKRFLKHLLDAAHGHCKEFIDWCASLGIARIDAAPAAPVAAESELQHEVAELLQRTEGHGRWLRNAILGMVAVMIVLGSTAAILGYRYRPMLAALVNPSGPAKTDVPTPVA